MREVNNWEITKELSDLPLQANSHNIYYAVWRKIKIILQKIKIIYYNYTYDLETTFFGTFALFMIIKQKTSCKPQIQVQTWNSSK